MLGLLKKKEKRNIRIAWVLRATTLDVVSVKLKVAVYTDTCLACLDSLTIKKLTQQRNAVHHATTTVLKMIILLFVWLESSFQLTHGLSCMHITATVHVGMTGKQDGGYTQWTQPQ